MASILFALSEPQWGLSGVTGAQWVSVGVSAQCIYTLTQRILRFLLCQKKAINDFFSVENKFISSAMVNVQGSMELINYEPAETNKVVE